MQQVLKIIYRSLITLFLVIVATLLAVGLYVYHHRSQITAQAFQAVMTKMAYSTQVKQVQLSLWKDFPQLSLVLHQVAVQGTTKEKKNILVARQIDCAFNIIHLMRGKYIVDHVAIEQGVLNLSTSTTGQPTSQVIRTSSFQQVPLTFKKLSLKHIDLLYTRSGKDPITLQTHIRHAQASMNMNQQHISMDAAGQAIIQQLTYQYINHQTTLPSSFHTHLHYDLAQQVFTITSGSIKQPAYALQVQGSWRLVGPKPFADLQIGTQQIDIQQLMPWLPPSLYKQIAPYQPQGKLAGQMHWKQHQKSSLKVDFTCQQGSILLQGIKERLQIARLAGKLLLPNGPTQGGGSLQVDDCVARIGSSELQGAFNIMNFRKPHLQAQASLQLDLPTLAQALSYTTLTHITGQLTGKCGLNASLERLLHPTLQQTPILLTGELKSKDIQFNYHKTRFQLRDTSVLFNPNNTWSIAELVGQVDGKTFVLAGNLQGGSALLLKGSRPMHFTARLYADHLALDKLLAKNGLPLDNTKPTTDFYIAPFISGTLTCDINEVAYKRFHGKKLRGKLEINNQQLKAEDLACSFAGGNIRFAGTLDAQCTPLHIITKASLQNVQLPTFFYTFENFQQHFLEDKHLGGQLSSDITLSMKADRQFQVDGSSISGDMSVRLQNGVLKNFEPLQRLSSYVSEKDLHHLHFSSLKNNIHIQDKTIYIPSMKVHTSVTSIQLSGTHTFDGKIAYNLIVPLQQADHEVKQNFLEIDETALAGLNLYLKLEGNVKDYTLHYDNTLLKKELKENLRRQGDMLTNLFKGKTTKKQDKELATDEYFNFE